MAFTGEKRAVLLAEDDDDQRAALEEFLGDAGFQVTAVKDGVEALRAMEERRFAAAVIDLEMPRLDGRGVLQARTNTTKNASLPIIIVTGADNLSGLEAATAVRRKPVRLPELVALLELVQQ